MTHVRYHKRQVSFLGIEEHRGWTIKQYLILGSSRRPEEGEFMLARHARTMIAALPLAGSTDAPDLTNGSHAILIVHAGERANWYLPVWWVNGDTLRQRMFRGAREDATTLEDITDLGLIGRVWELAILDFERRTWIKTMMPKKGAPDPQRYLTTALTGMV
ncbi:MAG: hypothetical protein Q8P46_16470 [Hyphomicrobiales bacterium]|nr:hypothetical protein [Hyphomicrobiales bacterium]